MKKILIIITAILIIGGVVLIINKKSAIENAPTAEAQKIKVELVNTKEGELRESREFLGEVAAKDNISLTTKVSAFTIDLPKEGSVIKKGELLILLDAREVEESIKAIEESIKALSNAIKSQKITLSSQISEVEFVKSKTARDRRLFEIGAISKEQLQRAELEEKQIEAKADSTKSLTESKISELKALEGNMKVKKEELKYFVFKSPIDGVIDRVYIEKGEMSTPGKPLLDVLGSERVIRFTAPLDFDISLGSKVESKEAKGEVTHIYESTKSHQKEYEATIEGDIRVGELKNISVLGDTHRGFMLPCKALLYQEGSYVYRYSNGKFIKELVTLLAKNGDSCLIDKNLNSVAIAHPSTLLKLSINDNVEIVQ